LSKDSGMEEGSTVFGAVSLWPGLV
jgi:hypothetical protein